MESIDPDVKENGETIADPLKYGASYKREDPKNALKMINTTLEIFWNHPVKNNHIVELLILWRANVDQKTIKTYEQLVQYVLKWNCQSPTTYGGRLKIFNSYFLTLVCFYYICTWH